MIRNLHQLYYKDYFKDVFSKGVEPSSVIKKKNDALCKPNQLQIIPCLDVAKYKLQCKVLYPGLATGIGIDHEAGIEGEFKLGLHFDWTYGMPVIYGSSVKGLLRSYFKDMYTPKNDQPGKDDAWKDIFEGERKSIYDRDIFFDAVIVKADTKGRILCPDSITPHQGPLKNPIPITFMKIAPGCVLEFRFKLVDSVIKLKGSDNPLVLKAEEKLYIFKEILTTVGIGAKTNVGYGQLEAL